MGGVFGVVSQSDCVADVFFGTDYHSHLGTKNGGMCLLGERGFMRQIHSIAESPFRSRFRDDLSNFRGNFGIGAISDGDPQPLTVRNKFGHWAITTVGRINNKEELVGELIREGNDHFMTKSSGDINNTELIAALVSTGDDLVEGIVNAQNRIDGSVTLLILTREGMYAARDKFGRTPLILGKKDGAYCAASESFAFINIGYEYERELGAGEIAFLQPTEEKILRRPLEKMKICTFLWSYFGYTTSTYEGKNVEMMRNKNGEFLAMADDDTKVDYVAGVPDSGTAHALGYANKSQIPYARPLIKYTPTWSRSFMPTDQKLRNQVAQMKLIPVFQLIKNKKFVLIDDSIVRGTQLSETVSYLIENGAKEIHVRSASPPIMFPCKYLNFSRTVSSMELITHRVIKSLEGQEENWEIPDEVMNRYKDENTAEYRNMVEEIRREMDFNSLKFQKLSKLLEATEVDSCKLCTYCWNGEE